MSIKQISEWTTILVQDDAAAKLLESLEGLDPKFSANNYMNVINLITACRLYEANRANSGYLWNPTKVEDDND